MNFAGFEILNEIYFHLRRYIRKNNIFTIQSNNET
jgi:hypothetical protein